MPRRSGPGRALRETVAAILGGKGTDPTLLLRDSGGVERSLELLHSAPDQLNSLLPADALLGEPL